MISNIEIYLAIAMESHGEMNRLFSACREPKRDGSPGYIVHPDINRGSFKQALICIAFLGMYFEALTYLTARDRFSKTKALTIDGFPYEKRLEALGVTDPSLLQSAKQFREMRRDLVHEKAIHIDEIGTAKIHSAQDSANEAMAFIRSVTAALPPAP
jgi:hypothetical protein